MPLSAYWILGKGKLIIRRPNGHTTLWKRARENVEYLKMCISLKEQCS